MDYLPLPVRQQDIKSTFERCKWTLTLNTLRKVEFTGQFHRP
jgi:DNA-binding LytR/AlgR family response regulator